MTDADTPGFFARLRKLPGFTTAAVAFCLTLAVGLGGTVAHALWSQSGSAAVSVQAGTVPSVGGLACMQTNAAPKRPNTVTLTWTAAAGRPPTGYRTSLQLGSGTETVLTETLTVTSQTISSDSIPTGSGPAVMFRVYAKDGTWVSVAVSRALSYTRPGTGKNPPAARLACA